MDVHIHGPGRVRPGDQIEVGHHGHLHGVDTADQVVPAPGVVWVRNVLDGHRRTVHVHDADLRYHLCAEPR